VHRVIRKNALKLVQCKEFFLITTESPAHFLNAYAFFDHFILQAFDTVLAFLLLHFEAFFLILLLNIIAMEDPILDFVFSYLTVSAHIEKLENLLDMRRVEFC